MHHFTTKVMFHLSILRCATQLKVITAHMLVILLQKIHSSYLCLTDVPKPRNGFLEYVIMIGDLNMVLMGKQTISHNRMSIPNWRTFLIYSDTSYL